MSKMLSKMNLISVVQQLPKEDIETIQGYVEMIEDENEKLKKQVENYKKLGFKYLQDKNNNLEKQQQEFIKFLKDGIKSSSTFDTINKQTAMYIYSATLIKYRSIIGVSNENN